MIPGNPDFEWEREVPCYCGYTKVVTRRPPAYDRYAVCSVGCWSKMVREGNEEPGSLLRRD
jgi:hypothetical protein